MKQDLTIRYVLLSKSPKTLNICSDFHPRHPLFCLCRGLYLPFFVTSQQMCDQKSQKQLFCPQWRCQNLLFRQQ